MLGRLRMTIDQVIESYTKLASKIFAAGLLSKIGSGATTGARFSAENLENAIKEVVALYSGNNNKDAPMRDPLENGCPV